MATIAFIESNTTGTGHILAQKALARGLTVAFLSGNPDRYPYVEEELLHPVMVDTRDEAAMLARLKELDDLQAVLSSSEYYLESAARLAGALGLPASDPEAIAICRDKWRLRERLSARGCPVPLTSRIDAPEQALACWERHRHPAVVKPISGSGSIDVRQHGEVETFLAHVGAILARTTNERGQPVQPVVLVQDLVEGPEYSVEMFGTGDGYHLVGITRKHLGEPPHFLETGHDFPAPLDPDLHRRIKEVVCAALDAVGLTSGPSHTELRVEDGRPVIIEINPRLGGGMIPVLIELATGVDVLEAILDLQLGLPVNLEPAREAAASIAFLIPAAAGQLTGIELPARAGEGIAETWLKKRVGDSVTRIGDFRDRIGHVIAAGATPQESRARVLSELERIQLRVKSDGPAAEAPGGAADTGRLKQVLHPTALAIVRKPPDPAQRTQELRWLAAIDEAHLLMLASEGILPPEKVRPPLEEIARLRAAGFGGLTHSVAPRGTYLLYEGALIDAIGVDQAGVTHTGRSRNDINACQFRLELRQPFEGAYRGLWRLRSALLRRAAQTLDVAMPVYSQFQPGLPGTFAYYLLSVEEALSRDQTALQQLLPDLDTSPLGACAGGGTPFPINPRETARLLGFSATCRSALDAVASRDLSLRMLAAAGISGMNISRLAQDFQLWTTREFGFLDMPDELAGGSSMMPQKKNPYLLEMVKGRASRVMGQWAGSTAVMLKSPFSNSVEVGTEAMPGLGAALRAHEEAAVLMGLIVTGAILRPERMRRSLSDGIVCASLVTDTMVAREGIAFRAAHHKVGAAITDALKAGADPEQAILAFVAEDKLGDDPLDWAWRYEHGGGPGRSATLDALRSAEARVAADAAWLRAAVGRWRQAEARRQAEVSTFLSKGAR